MSLAEDRSGIPDKQLCSQSQIACVALFIRNDAGMIATILVASGFAVVAAVILAAQQFACFGIDGDAFSV